MTAAHRVLAAVAVAAVAACTPEEGPLMSPGSDCLACHGNPGAEESGPTWFLAGTVYGSAQGTGKGVRGAAIVIVDATGRAVTLHSNQVGNFYLADRLSFPLHVAVERDGVIQTMPDPVAEGSCNRCHQPGAEGSIHAP
jgi:cytochrome c553